MTGTYQDVPVASCFVGESNARAGQAQADAELVASVQQFGVLVPLFVVMRVTQHDVEPDRNIATYEVVDGQRRLDAATKAGLTLVPALVWDELPEAEEIGVALNLLRQQLTAGQIAKAAGGVLLKLGFSAEDVRKQALTKKTLPKLMGMEAVQLAARSCGVPVEQFIRLGTLSSLQPATWERFMKGYIDEKVMSMLAEAGPEVETKINETLKPNTWISRAVIDEHAGAAAEKMVFSSMIEKSAAIFSNTKDLEVGSDLFGETDHLTPASAKIFLERQVAAAAGFTDELKKEIGDAPEGVELQIGLIENDPGYAPGWNYHGRETLKGVKSKKAAMTAILKTVKDALSSKRIATLRIVCRVSQDNGQVAVSVHTRDKRAPTAPRAGEKVKALTQKQFEEVRAWLCHAICARVSLLGEMADHFMLWAARTIALNSLRRGIYDNPFQPSSDRLTYRMNELPLASVAGGKWDEVKCQVAAELARNLSFGSKHQGTFSPELRGLMAALGMDWNEFKPSEEFLAACDKADLVLGLEDLGGFLTGDAKGKWLELKPFKSKPKKQLAAAFNELLKVDRRGWFPPGIVTCEIPKPWYGNPLLPFEEIVAGISRRSEIEPDEDDMEGADAAAQPDVHAAHQGDTPDGDADDEAFWSEGDQDQG